MLMNSKQDKEGLIQQLFQKNQTLTRDEFCKRIMMPSCSWIFNLNLINKRLEHFNPNNQLKKKLQDDLIFEREEQRRRANTTKLVKNKTMNEKMMIDDFTENNRISSLTKSTNYTKLSASPFPDVSPFPSPSPIMVDHRSSQSPDPPKKEKLKKVKQAQLLKK